MPEPLVVIFCRAPVPGLTKTRLTPPLDPEQAAALSLSMLLDVNDAIALVDHPMEARVADAADVGTVCGLLPEVSVRPQDPGHLGERLQRASDDAFAEGRPAVAIVGSDCPAVSARHVDGAFAALDGGADAALCPSADGGYGLIALARSCPELFREIPWSTGGVLDATRAAARAAGLRLAEAEPLDDVDRPEDLLGLVPRLAVLGVAPRTRHMLQTLGNVGEESPARP